MNIKYPLANSAWDNDELDAMQKVIDSGRFTMGPLVKEFEKAFAKYLNSEFCVMVNSGSSANLLIIAALFFSKKFSLKKGDEVIVPAVSWSTTYYPLQQYGLKLRFVDIDLYTLNYDIEKLKKSITKKTKLILAVNLLGNPNDFDALESILEDGKIILIEDNCESLGASFKGKKTGTFGLMGSYSTFFSHHISTMEGGIISTHDEELYQILLSLRAHGWTRDLPKNNLVCDKKSDNDFFESFRFILPGYNVRPLEIEGAIGLKQLKKLPNIISQRQKNGATFLKVMKNHPSIIVQKEVGESSWFGFSLIIKNDLNNNREELLKKLRLLGFETRPIVAGDFTQNPVIKYFDYEIPYELNNANYIHKNGLFIGNQHYPMNEAFDALSNLEF